MWVKFVKISNGFLYWLLNLNHEVGSWTAIILMGYGTFFVAIMFYCLPFALHLCFSIQLWF